MNAFEKQVLVIIADNQFLITESLSTILQTEGCYKINKVVTEKSDLIKALKQDPISLLIIDHSQIDFIGIFELKEIKTSFPVLKVLVITNCLSKAELHELNSAGISDIILKTASKEELFEALDATLVGGRYGGWVAERVAEIERYLGFEPPHFTVRIGERSPQWDLLWKRIFTGGDEN